jgi:hypothetical protein
MLQLLCTSSRFPYNFKVFSDRPIYTLIYGRHVYFQLVDACSPDRWWPDNRLWSWCRCQGCLDSGQCLQLEVEMLILMGWFRGKRSIGNPRFTNHI